MTGRRRARGVSLRPVRDHVPVIGRLEKGMGFLWGKRRALFARRLKGGKTQITESLHVYLSLAKNLFLGRLLVWGEGGRRA